MKVEPRAKKLSSASTWTNAPEREAKVVCLQTIIANDKIGLNHHYMINLLIQCLLQ